MATVFSSKLTLSIFPSKTNWHCDVDICCQCPLDASWCLCQSKFSPKEANTLKWFLYSLYWFLHHSTKAKRQLVDCRRAVLGLFLVSTWRRPSREQWSSSFSCETTKTINPVAERKRKHTATLYSIALPHLIFQSLPHRQELDPAKSTCECVWRDQNLKNLQHLYYSLAPLGLLESMVIGQIEAQCSAFTSKRFKHSCSNLKNLKGTAGRCTKLPLITRPGMPGRDSNLEMTYLSVDNSHQQVKQQSPINSAKLQAPSLNLASI